MCKLAHVTRHKTKQWSETALKKQVPCIDISGTPIVLAFDSSWPPDTFHAFGVAGQLGSWRLFSRRGGAAQSPRGRIGVRAQWRHVCAHAEADISARARVGVHMRVRAGVSDVSRAASLAPIQYIMRVCVPLFLIACGGIHARVRARAPLLVISIKKIRQLLKQTSQDHASIRNSETAINPDRCFESRPRPTRREAAPACRTPFSLRSLL